MHPGSLWLMDLEQRSMAKSLMPLSKRQEIVSSSKAERVASVVIVVVVVLLLPAASCRHPLFGGQPLQAFGLFKVLPCP